MAKRLAMIRYCEEVDGNVARTCRYYGISRPTYYKWLRRYEELGTRAFGTPRAGHTQPERDEDRGGRQDHLPAPALPLRPAQDLDVPQALPRHRRSRHSGVWRILKRLDMSRLPASQRYKRHADRWKRYEKPLPGHRVQVDVKFIAPIAGSRKKHYQFTAIDDCTRLRVLRIYDRLQPEDRDPVHRLRPREAPVPGRGDPDRQRLRVPGSRFHWHVLDRGIRHVYIKPATPRLNGKVERSHRIDAEEFYRMLEGVVIDDTELFNDKLQEWEDFYNFDRPHGALGGQDPLRDDYDRRPRAPV